MSYNDVGLIRILWCIREAISKLNAINTKDPIEINEFEDQSINLELGFKGVIGGTRTEWTEAEAVVNRQTSMIAKLWSNKKRAETRDAPRPIHLASVSCAAYCNMYEGL